jgi:hypothetical protein
MRLPTVFTVISVVATSLLCVKALPAASSATESAVTHEKRGGRCKAPEESPGMPSNYPFWLTDGHSRWQCVCQHYRDSDAYPLRGGKP